MTGLVCKSSKGAAGDWPLRRLNDGLLRFLEEVDLLVFEDPFFSTGRSETLGDGLMPNEATSECEEIFFFEDAGVINCEIHESLDQNCANAKLSRSIQPNRELNL